MKTRAEIEAAPDRKEWLGKTVYDSIFVLPTRKKHDSGWMLMCIVGVLEDKMEKAAWCDDICWHHPVPAYEKAWSMRTDMLYPSGIIHFWGNDMKFVVGSSLSSTDVSVIYVKSHK